MYAFQTNFLNGFKIIKCSSKENSISEERNEVPLEKINLKIERNEIFLWRTIQIKIELSLKRNQKKSYVSACDQRQIEPLFAQKREKNKAATCEKMVCEC